MGIWLFLIIWENFYEDSYLQLQKDIFCPQATNFSVQVRINQNFKFYIYPNFTEIQVCLFNFYLLLLLCYKKRLSSCEIPKGLWTNKAGWHLFYIMNWICLMVHIKYKELNPWQFWTCILNPLCWKREETWIKK